MKLDDYCSHSIKAYFNHIVHNIFLSNAQHRAKVATLLLFLNLIFVATLAVIGGPVVAKRKTRRAINLVYTAGLGAEAIFR